MTFSLGSNLSIFGTARIQRAMAASMWASRIRNASVVSEISELGDCPIQFDTENSAVINSHTFSHIGFQTLAALLSSGLPPPCAAVGLSDDIPGVDLFVMAAAFKFPETVHRGFKLHLLTDITSPYTTQLYPDIISTTLSVFFT
jgi:hypothetical protein